MRLTEDRVPRLWTRSILKLAKRLRLFSLRNKCKHAIHNINALDTSEAELHFDKLQFSFPPHDEAKYAYDHVSNWKRGVDRAQDLIKMTNNLGKKLKILEVGCGDGMTGVLLSAFGHDVMLTDMEDWRDERSRKLPIIISKLEAGLNLECNLFDLIYSYNTFEHLEDPEAALKELCRVCRPGGLIFLDFGPLYASPWGLHAYRMLRMPYPQFLFSNEFIEKKLRDMGIRDLGKSRSVLQPLNQWKVKQFENLWNSSGCEVVSTVNRFKYQYVELVWRYPKSFSGRLLTFEDLTTSSIQVRLRKKIFQ